MTKTLADIKPGDHFISTAQGMPGNLMVVEYWINNEMGNDPGNCFVEPWDVLERWISTPEAQEAQAKAHAELLGLPYVPASAERS